MDKKESLKKVKNNGWDLYELDDKFKKDKDVVTAAVKAEPGAIEYAHKSLLDDKKLFSMAILQSKNGMIMKLAGPKLKKDKKFVMEMLTKTKDNYVLEYADQSLKSDKDLQAQAQKNLEQ